MNDNTDDITGGDDSDSDIVVTTTPAPGTTTPLGMSAVLNQAINQGVQMAPMAVPQDTLLWAGGSYPMSPESMAIIMQYVNDVHGGDMEKARQFTLRKGDNGRPLTSLSPGALRPSRTNSPQDAHVELHLLRLAQAHYSEITKDTPLSQAQVEAKSYFIAALMGRNTTGEGRPISGLIVEQVKATMDNFPVLIQEVLKAFIQAKTKGEYNDARASAVGLIPALDRRYREVQVQSQDQYLGVPYLPTAEGDIQALQGY